MIIIGDMSAASLARGLPRDEDRSDQAFGRRSKSGEGIVGAADAENLRRTRS
ncbi:MAG: hypothetical protein ACLPN5_03975 [Roseiarcus sp.]